MAVDGGERAPSIRDVANAAGVSHQTVSRVLNGRSGIRPDTERRVRRAMDDLDWRPSRAARSLATSRHRTVGVLTSARGLHGPLQAAVGLEEAARARGYGYASAAVLDDRVEAIADALAALLEQGVDGIVVSAPQRGAREALWSLAPAVPAVSLSAGGIGRVVALDQVHGSRLAAAHVADLGHTRIALLPGPAGWVEADERRAGYLAELAERHLEPVLLPAGDWSSDSGYAVARAALPDRRFTAVLCGNDEMAIGLLHAAHDLGIAVPEELSVVGFDDVTDARHLIPPLTTVRQDFVQLGRRAMDVLIDEIDQRTPRTGPELRLDLRLVVRRSTAAVAGSPPAP